MGDVTFSLLFVRTQCQSLYRPYSSPSSTGCTEPDRQTCPVVDESAWEGSEQLNLPNSFAKEQWKDKTLNKIFKYKKDGTLPSNRKRAHTIATQDSRFVIDNGILYYLDPEQHG